MLTRPLSIATHEKHTLAPDEKKRKRKPGVRSFGYLGPHTKRAKPKRSDPEPFTAPRTSHTKHSSEIETKRKAFILRVTSLLRAHKGNPRTKEAEMKRKRKPSDRSFDTHLGKGNKVLGRAITLIGACDKWDKDGSY